MSRSHGQVVERKGKTGVSYGLRFHVNGRRYYTTAEAKTRPAAEQELADILSDVRRGKWSPPAAAPAITVVDEPPSFHEYASRWFESRRPALKPRSQENVRWALEHHLLAHFADYRIDRITIRDVDDFRIGKLRDRERDGRGLSNGSINRCLTILAAILDEAREDGLTTGDNPARGRRRRLKAETPDRTFLELHEFNALLEACETAEHRALIAVMCAAGLRVSEACALKWGAIELPNRRLWVAESKTPAGRREIDILPPLYDALAAHEARVADRSAEALLFVNRRGGQRTKNNVGRNVLLPALKRANKVLEAAGYRPMPLTGEHGAITNHSLRRTQITLLCEAGAPLNYVMQQAGHTSPDMTLGIYAKVMNRDRSDVGERVEQLLAASTIQALSDTNGAGDGFDEAVAALLDAADSAR